MGSFKIHYIVKPTLKEEEIFKVPDGVEIISGGNNYYGLIIPSSVKKICGEIYNGSIYAPKNSYAIKYAKQKDIDFYEVDYDNAIDFIKKEYAEEK